MFPMNQPINFINYVQGMPYEQFNNIMRALVADVKKHLFNTRQILDSKKDEDERRYWLGIYNGIEMALSVIEIREPNYLHFDAGVETIH